MRVPIDGCFSFLRSHDDRIEAVRTVTSEDCVRYITLQNICTRQLISSRLRAFCDMLR